MDEAIQEKRAWFKAGKALKKGGKTAEAKEADTGFNDTKHVAKHAVWLAKSEAEKEEFPILSPDGDGVFHITKQIDRTNQDVIGENCVRALTDEEKMNAWVELC